MATVEHQISEHVANEANRLIEEGRIRLCATQLQMGAVVMGRRGDYQVWFAEEGVSCDCRAGADHGWTEPRCCHAVAAMVVWSMALSGESWLPNGFLG